MQRSVGFFLVVLSAAVASASTAVPSNELSRAAQRWVSLNPLFGAGTTVSSIEMRKATAIVRFAPRGTAVFSLSRRQPPVRVFGTGEVVAADGEMPETDESSEAWARLLSTGSVLSLPETGNVTEKVGPLSRVHWGQERHFNRFTPRRGGDRTDGRQVTGCVATAITQVLAQNRWPRWPEQRVNSSSGELVTFTQPYLWELMPSRYSLTERRTNIMAVARVMLDCGHAVNMNYYGEGDSSGAQSDSESPDAFRYNFRYRGCKIKVWDVGTGWLTGEATSDTATTDIMKQNLRDGFVCMTCGMTKENHAFVCDGFATVDGTDYFHYNYGWSGSADNWVLKGYGYEVDGTPYVLRSAIYNLVPSKEPVLEPVPQVVAPGGGETLAWGIADCHTNAVQRFGLVTEKQRIISGYDLNFADWTDVRDGWTTSDGELVGAVTGTSWISYPLAYPYSEELTLAGTESLTVVYSYRHRDTKMCFYLFTATEGEYGLEYDWDTAADTPANVLLSFPNTTAVGWVTATQTVSLASFRGVENLHLAICPYNKDDSQTCTLSSGTEVLRIEKMTVGSGAGAAVWQTVGTNLLAAAARSVAIPGRDDGGKYRYTLFADYGGTNQFAATERPIVDVSTTNRGPVVAVAENGNAVIFTVDCPHAWTYVFTKQESYTPTDGSPAMSTSVSRSGNVVTVDFTNAGGIAALGSYWLNVRVTDSVTGYTADGYRILNPPDDYPAAYLAHTKEEAFAKAAASGRPVFMASVFLNDEERPATKRYAAILTNDLVRARLETGYVYWEQETTTLEGRAVADEYYTRSLSSSSVLLNLYGFIIDPATDTAREQMLMDFSSAAEVYSFLGPLPKRAGTLILLNGGTPL
jgi:hypothetical protein